MSLFNFIKSNLSILDIISEYVQLKAMGNYWKGSCPFHAEKDASFTVSPDKQIFYCFGCHAGGDIISFIAKTENLSQLEAVKFLITRYNISVPQEILQTKEFKNLEKTEEKDLYFNLCKAFAEWANKQLLEYEDTKKYISDRSINTKSIKTFQIGYFPGGLKSINKFIKEMTTQNFLAKDLIEAGILTEGQSVLYSPFEERIIFPIKDVLGRYCGFGGRIFKPSDQRPKYYNSKESSGFLKGKLLFGLDFAKKDMQNSSCAYLVEGYFDCIAMSQYGYQNTVATLGTACTQEHLKILSRYIKILYVMYDGDQAGQKAILRLTQLCWDVNLELKIVKLPSKEDPASFLAKNGDLEPLIKQANDIFTFFIESVGSDFWQSSLSEKTALCEKIIDLLAKIEDSFKQELLFHKASSTLQIPFLLLKDLTKKRRFYTAVSEKPDLPNLQKIDPINDKKFDIPLLEERIFSAIINSMDKPDRFYVETDLIPYFSEYIQSLLEKIETFLKNPNHSDNFKFFLEALDEPDKSWVIKCSLKYDTEITDIFFKQLIFHFCKQHWKVIIQDIKLKLSKAKQIGDQKKVSDLFILFSKLKDGIKSRGLI